MVTKGKEGEKRGEKIGPFGDFVISARNRCTK